MKLQRSEGSSEESRLDAAESSRQSDSRAALESLLQHAFRQPQLLFQALNHSSLRHEFQAANSGAPLPEELHDNERLEFLGDAIVGLVVAESLYRRFPELDEGELTRMRAALVSRRHLGLVATELELGEHLRLGRAEERSGGRKKSVLLANALEALIAAVYLDAGAELKTAAAFIERVVVEPSAEDLRDELRENSAIGDFKSALQERLQAERAGHPVYLVQAETGPDHRKRFLVEVLLRAAGEQDKPLAQGSGSTKKKAEQAAARVAIELLRTASERGVPA
jgi:ribonuclease-3